jgi:predicted transcriptional regulator of viral defense system
MNNVIYQKIYNVFMKNQGYVKTKELLGAGIHSDNLLILEQQGDIEKIRHGIYRWVEYEFEHNEELVHVSKIVPNGVICLLSALSYYEFTTYQPWEYYVAIHRDDTKVKLPEYPPIKLMYFSDIPYHVGIDTISINDNQVKIYDIEKTLCDCARYQNKIGQDIVKEGFKNYVRGSKKNVHKLLEYAEKMRVKNHVSKYLEVLL